jgi:hypothetical protein
MEDAQFMAFDVQFEEMNMRDILLSTELIERCQIDRFAKCQAEPRALPAPAAIIEGGGL